MPETIYRLGKLPHVHRGDHLSLARYALPGLPPPPPSMTFSHAVNGWPMMGNDTLGDCVLAAMGHATEVYTVLTGTEVVPPDQEIVGDYSAITGYTPGNPATDNGTVIADALAWWTSHPIGGKSIFARAELTDPTNHTLLQQAHALFGGLILGVALPLTAQAQVAAGQPWDVVSAPPSQNAPGTWGGHGIYVPDYDAQGLTCVTWGKLQPLTWQWLDTYCDEAWVCLPDEFQGAAGFDWNALTSDLLAIGNG